MFNVLRKLVAPELIEAIGFPRIRFNKVGHDPHHNRRKQRASREKLIRKWEGRMMEAAALNQTNIHLWPPKRGSRRPEWSSSVEGQWSTISGAPNA